MKGPISALADPFEARDVEWRAQSTGTTRDGKPWIRVLAYIDNRAIMERLDEVCGPENWRNEFTAGPHGGVLCGLSILVSNDAGTQWVTKWDGAENTDIEGVKGGLSGSMKRAGYQWGIGRYLYNLEEGFGTVSPNGEHYMAAKADKHGEAFKWDAPRLPAWALPGGSGKPGVASAAQQTRAAAATAELAKVPSADVRLPGAPKQLHGNGGKRIGDVPSDVLTTIVDELRALPDDARAKYLDTIEAIGDVLADRAGVAA